MVSFEFTIRDPLGIHARPAGQLVKQAASCSGKITVQKGTRTADLKKIFGLMNLAIKCNDTIKVIVDGDNEETEAEKIRSFLEENL